MNDKGNLNFLFACTISELSLVSCSILGFDLFDNQIIHVSSSVDGKMTILGINIGTILGPFDDWLWALKNYVKLKYIFQNQNKIREIKITCRHIELQWFDYRFQNIQCHRDHQQMAWLKK